MAGLTSAMPKMEQLAIEEADIFRVTSSTTSQTDVDEDNRDGEIRAKLKAILSGYNLTVFSMHMALGWLERVADPDNSQLDRVRAWILQKLNDVRVAKSVPALQRGCPEVIPGLRTTPFWDTSLLPWVAELESKFDIIRDELLSLRGRGGFQPYRTPTWASKTKAKDGLGGVAHQGGDWNIFYLHLHNMDFSENRALCPQTSAAIAAIPGQYEHAMFSALAPGTHVTPHNGPTNKKLRCHLPLIVPTSGPTGKEEGMEGGEGPEGESMAKLRVGEHTVSLQEGRCVVFDDSFQHEAWNHSPTSARLVLIVDVWHPDLTAGEIKFFSFLQHAHMRAELKQSQQGAKRRAAAAAGPPPATGGSAENVVGGVEVEPVGVDTPPNDPEHVVRVVDAVMGGEGGEGGGRSGVVGDGDDFFTVIEAAKAIRPDEAMLWS